MKSILNVMITVGLVVYGSEAASGQEVVTARVDRMHCSAITFEGAGQLSPIHSATPIPETPRRLPLWDFWTAITSGPFANNPSGTTRALWLLSSSDTLDILFDEPVSAVGMFYSSVAAVRLEAFDSHGMLLGYDSGHANFQGDGFSKWDPLRVTTSRRLIVRVTIKGGRLRTVIDDFQVCPVDPLEVDIDVEPHTHFNSVSLGAARLPVAILSSAIVDATTVDPETVRLAGATVGIVGQGSRQLCHVEDVNADALPDLFCQVQNFTRFLTAEGGTLVVLKAVTFGGVSILGEDTVYMVP